LNIEIYSLLVLLL